MKRYIEETITIDEIVNYQGKLCFIINNSPFIVSTKNHFSDTGYVGKYEINDVQFIYNSKFHITNKNYYEFNELNITSEDVKIKINIKNRLKLKYSIFFAKKFIDLISTKYPLIKFNYFIGKTDSYIYFNNDRKMIELNDLLLFIDKILVREINFYFNISSIINIDNKFFIFFNLYDYPINMKTEENFGIISKYNFSKLFDSWYYDIISNINFVYYILDKSRYYLLANIKDRDKFDLIDKNIFKDTNIIFHDEIPNTSFFIKKYNNFKCGFEHYLKIVKYIF